MSIFTSGDDRFALAKIQESLAQIAQVAGSNNAQSPVVSDEDKRKAAYALNLCTVSVSQIVDYNDLGIMEQEYEAILNNLNIENMPKDEALLDILKHLLDTITYFRIEAGKKAMLEQEYQHNIKNAIWSAVPSLSVIMGGSPLAVAASLATQAGIGYMNYRKTKASLLLAKEKNEWQLQRSAMEQLNGLRRELFETAWRLADTYQFPDEYRLTERQITQYNQILLDKDPLRRYERLLYIEPNFQAYPPFHYYIGHAANEAGYPDKAMVHFEKLLNLASQNILREDQILAACALEYFELRLQGKEQITDSKKAELSALLQRASKSAGNANDVLQLCAMAYLRISDWDNATNLMRMLVNEGHNQIVNAQFLSSYYVEGYLTNRDPDLRILYTTLKTRVPEEYLLRLPPCETPLATSAEQNAAREQALREFILLRRTALYESYRSIVSDLADQYTVKYNKMRFAEIFDDTTADFVFEDTPKALAIQAHEQDERKEIIFTNGKELTENMLATINACYEDLASLPFTSEETLEEVHSSILKKLSHKKVALQYLAKNKEIIYKLFLSLSFDVFMEDAFRIVIKKAHSCLENCTEMKDISIAETKLLSYKSMKTPNQSEEIFFDHQPSDYNKNEISWKAFSQYAQIDMQEDELKERMSNCIASKQNSLLKEKAKNVKLYYAGSSEFNDFFKAHQKNLATYKSATLLVLDNTQIPDEDWLLTIHGLCSYHHPIGAKSLSATGAATAGATAGFAGAASAGAATATATIPSLTATSWATSSLVGAGVAASTLSAATVAAFATPAIALGVLGYSILTKSVGAIIPYTALELDKNGDVKYGKKSLALNKLDIDKNAFCKLITELQKIQQELNKSMNYHIDSTHEPLSKRIFATEEQALAVIED
ncbi:hypothetical protein RFF05_04845 [Bengtsoniella intestinalis]|uniref:hypothetical protein n=1 Tax=Bengtsoniella intestinalis TaxID=3073143 RepID=UPI00391EFB0F